MWAAFLLMLGVGAFGGILQAQAAVVSIGAVSQSTATVGMPISLSVSASAPSGIKSCNLYVDNNDQGAMIISGGTASLSYTFTSAQIYTVFVFCRDNAGNFSSGANASVWAKMGSGGGSSGDITPPVIGSLTPTSATVGQPVAFVSAVSDNGGLANCHLFIGSQDRGEMTLASGSASKNFTFTEAGPTSAYIRCADTAGNQGTGSTIAVSVSLAPVVSPTTPSVPTTPIGSLIKLACLDGALADDPCKAVYYLGTDGKRHAFPNSKVFFTWYSNFDSVKTVSSQEMANASLGKNVTYRPGVRMVKFTTLPSVYAVSKGGVLRWVKTEADASALYGSEWNKNIDDIADTFFSSYRFGTDVTPSAPFIVMQEMNAATTIDQTL